MSVEECKLGLARRDFLDLHSGCHRIGTLLCCDISPWKKRKTYHVKTEGMSLSLFRVEFFSCLLTYGVQVTTKVF